jgi:hypothetical protein
VGGVFQAIGGYIQSGFKLALEGASAVGGAFQKVGGAIATGLKTAGGFGKAIGDKIATGMKTAPAWMAIGGAVALGIGAVALGAAIGYAMWKAYKSYEEGRDIFKGQSELEIYQGLTTAYGMTDPKALALSEALGGKTPEGEIWKDKISTSRGGFERFAEAFAEIELVFNKWGVDASGKPRFDLMAPAMSTLERGEGDFILKFLTENKDQFALSAETIEHMNTAFTGFTKYFEDEQKLGTGEVAGGNYTLDLAVPEKGSVHGLHHQIAAEAGGEGFYTRLSTSEYNLVFRKIMNELYGILPGQEGDFTKYTESGGFLGTGIGKSKDYTRGFSPEDIAAGMTIMWQRDPQAAIRFMDPDRRKELGFGDEHVWDEIERRYGNKSPIQLQIEIDITEGLKASIQSSTTSIGVVSSD